MPKSQVLHGGYAGRSIIERIQEQMDKRRKAMERILTETPGPIVVDGIAFKPKEHTLNQGRYEGLAAALAIMRTSSLAEEVSRSNERLGIE